jgi:hypothetical protein
MRVRNPEQIRVENLLKFVLVIHVPRLRFEPESMAPDIDELATRPPCLRTSVTLHYRVIDSLTFLALKEALCSLFISAPLYRLYTNPVID